MTARALARLRRDQRGATIVEFAIVVPVMLTLLLGLCDLMYQSFVQALLDGAMIKAGRDSALEMNAQAGAALDASVRQTVQQAAPHATFAPERRSYASFSLAKPETFDDKNKNGVRDKGECFDDVNGNGVWDAEPGAASQGGANDVTRYTMVVTYPRLFPAGSLLGWGTQATIRSSTLLKNQPYRTQVTEVIKSICS